MCSRAICMRSVQGQEGHVSGVDCKILQFPKQAGEKGEREAEAEGCGDETSFYM